MKNWFVSLARQSIERFPRLAELYRGVRDQLDFERHSQTTPWGFRLAGNKDMAAGVFEPKETQIIRDLLQGVEILVNVGANVGYYCCHARSMGKRVIAFEPIPRNVRYLCKNIKENGWSDVEIFPLALSNKTGILEIYGGTTGASIIKGWANIPESYVMLVPASTMDIVLGNRLQGHQALVLVDIEGAEKWMLDGAAEMLASNPRPIWVMEICFTENLSGKVNEDFHEIFNLFWKYGYRSFSVDADMREVKSDDVLRWITQGFRDFGYVTYLFR